MAARRPSWACMVGATALVLLEVSGAWAALAGSKPNIVFILSDDLGYGDYSASWDGVQPGMKLNATHIPTPNVGRMVKNGMRFQRGYSGQVCAPSRTMLMLGKHLGHTTIRGNDGAYTPLLASDTTVAKVLKDAGYATMLSGKWGLGNFGTTGYPNAQGFDKFVGQDTQVGCHNWYPLTVCNDTGTTQGVTHSTINTPDDLAYIQCLGPHSTCTWANDLDRTEGVKFIMESHAAKTPFFLYLASTTPHAGDLRGTGPKPALFSAYNPVPYPYNTKFADANATSPTPELWTAKEKLFASAVWAEDVMVGAVLDTLESLSIEQETVVFFSGDNGPDIPGVLFDDAGYFRGKKRSLHEGGIRQTIVVQWPGTIAANSVSDDMFIFYDFLPTAAELAGVPRSSWPYTDGLSAVPSFEATRSGVVSTRADAKSDATVANRFLYYEFCHNGMVDGLLPQQYASGWGQALRFDSNTTTHRTEWKAIAVNSNWDNILLYNLTDDPSESVPLAGTPVGPDGTWQDLKAAKLTDPSDVKHALAFAIELFKSEHVENPYWKSSKNASDPCCASCFSPTGCKFPCKTFGPSPPPSPSPVSPPGPPIASKDLVGDWHAHDEDGDVTFGLTMTVDGEVAIQNQEDKTSCWKTCDGAKFDAERNQIATLACHGCTRSVVGFVRRQQLTKVIDHDYNYASEVLELSWQVTGEGANRQWPTWHKTVTQWTIQQ